MALPSADALFGGQSKPAKPKADALFAPSAAPAAKPSADDLFGETTAQMVARNTPHGAVRYVDDQGTNQTFANPAEAARARAAPDREAPGGFEGMVRREVGAPPQADGPGYVNPASAFWHDYTKRTDAAKAAIGGAVSNDVARGQFIQAAFKRGGPQAARAAELQWDHAHRGAPSDFAAMGEAANLPFTPIEGAIDTVAGRPLEIATRGKVNRQMAGDVGVLFVPGGAEEKAATEAEKAAQTALRRGGATSRSARVLLDEQRALKTAELPKADELFAKAPKKKPAGYGEPVSLETGSPGAKPLAPVRLNEKTPGPVYATGRATETPIQTAQRVDDALHRLKNSATADKLEIQEYLRRLPEEHQDPKVQEELYRAIEHKLVDPKAEIPEHLRPAYEAMGSLYKEQTDLANEIRARGGGDVTAYDHEQGYVHRIAKGKGSFFDAADTEGMGRTDPITGKRSLSKTTGSLKSRKFAVIVDPKTGKRSFVEGEEYVPGTKIKGSFGKTFEVKQATTNEIEANTDVRYHKNALLSTVDNVARLRRVKRNLDVLDSLVADAKGRGMAERTEWHYKNDRGEWVRAQGNADVRELRAKGFRETTVPQLKGVWFDKHIADAVEDFYGKDKGDLANLLTKTNRLLSSSLFITPVPHALNVLGHWAVGRGWDWLNPYAYARAAKYGTRAVKEVLSGGSEYRALLREGSGLMYGDIATENFHKVLIEKMAGEIAADPAMTPVAKSFGLRDAGQLAKAVYDAVYRTSNRALWAANDIFMLSRQYELMDQGLSVREAIHEAERDIPNYRIPPQVMGQRWLTEALRSPNYTLFGRYKYGMFRAYAAMFRDMFRGSADERIDAVGKFVAMIGLATVALPFADQAVQAVTGNKDAKMRRFGPLSVPGAVAEWTQGQRDWAGMLASVITPAPVLAGAGEVLTNRDDFGRHIIEPESTPLGQTVQAAEAAADKFYPTQLAVDAARQDNPVQALERTAGKMVGVDVPRANREAGRAKAKRYEQRMARSRERKDPIERMLKEGGL